MTIVRTRRSKLGLDPTGGQLAEGEFGYAYTSEKLFVGGVGGSTVTEVGGGSFVSLLTATPGVATADKAVILDSNSEIDSWTVVGLVEAETFKTSLPVNAGFVKNDVDGNFLFGLPGSSELDDLSDVTLTSPAIGEFLRNDGAGQFVNVLIVEADISDLQNYALVGHTHLEADITDLQAYLLDITGESIDDLSDVDTTGIGTGKHLIFNGTNWVPVANDFIGLADTPPDYSGAGLLFLRVDSGVSFVEFVSISLSDLPAIALDDLSDVTVSTPATKSNLRFNGSQWVDQTDLVGTSVQIDTAGIAQIEFIGSGVEAVITAKNSGLEIDGDGLVEFRDDLQLFSTTGIFLGEIATDDTWKMGRSGGSFEDLSFQRRESATFVSKVVFTSAGDLELPTGDVILTTTTKAYYLGDPGDDGTWRFVRNGSDLEIQLRESGTYNAKTTITP